MAEQMTTVKVSKRNRDRLANFGRVGDSFDDALERVLTIAEEHEAEKKRKQDPLNALIPALA